MQKKILNTIYNNGFSNIFANMVAQRYIIELFSAPPPENKGWILCYEGDISLHSLQTIAKNYSDISFKLYVQNLGRREPMGDLEYFASKIYACKI